MTTSNTSRTVHERCRQLELENRLLRAELERHGIALPTLPRDESADLGQRLAGASRSASPLPAAAQDDGERVRGHASSNGLSGAVKIALFRSIFRGRDDVYARRWENPTKRTSGYTPARPAPWQSEAENASAGGFVDRQGRRHLPLTNGVIERHLLGEEVIGLYPLDRTGRCRLLVADFDGGAWRDDVQAFARTCADSGVPILLEISRSGDGAHAWLLFDAPVTAADARRLAFGLLERTSSERRLLALSSYDRLIPNQDTLPDGRFGSLVALPLQKQARARGGSLFVDADLCPFEDQWSALAELIRIPASTLPERLQALRADGFALDAGDEPNSQDTPWRAAVPVPLAASSLPPVIRFTLADGLYIDRRGLPLALVRRFARLAAFANPT